MFAQEDLSTEKHLQAQQEMLGDSLHGCQSCWGSSHLIKS